MMRRRMYPNLFIGGVGGPSDEYFDKGKGVFTTNNQTPKAIISYDLSNEAYPGLGVERTTSTTPTESTEATTNNSEVKETASTTSTKSPFIDTMAQNEIKSAMETNAQASFVNAPPNINPWLSSEVNPLPTYYDSANIPEGTTKETLHNGNIAVAFRLSENETAQYGAIYDTSGKILSKHTNVNGKIQIVNFEYDETGTFKGYSTTLDIQSYYATPNKNMEDEGLMGNVLVTATYDSNGELKYYTVNGENLDYINNFGIQENVGGLQNYVADANGDFHVMTSEEFERFNNQ